MSQRCPVCNSPLWTDPLLTPTRLKCPRCGSDFRPTVPWRYLRILLLLVVAFALLAIVSLSETHFWVLLFLVGLTVFFWFLPRFIDLERISGELTTPEGPMDTSQLRLKLKDDNQDRKETLDEEQSFRRFVYLLISVILLLLFVVSLVKGL